jgi:LPS export ABC transporter protein LptC
MISIKHIRFSIAAFGVAMLLFISCGETKKDYVTGVFDPETVPSINSDSVAMLVSDSGLIRYKLVAQSWQFFDEAKEPHWYFPKGFYVEQFDSLFHVEVSVKSDTAWRYTRKSLWKLKGHVFVKNIRNETFASEELYWDEKSQKIYTDKYIEIQQPDKLMLKGMGMESNQSLTSYRIKKPINSNIYINDME